MTKIQRSFPQSYVAIIHQNGSELTVASQGVEVILYTRENESNPCAAEIISGEHHAEIGLFFEGKELVDFDGVFFLPREVGEILNDAGYIVSEDFFK